MKTSRNLQLIFCLICLLLSAEKSTAQTANENYVKSYRALIPLTGDLSIVNDKTKVQETTQYLDGHGRSVQSVLKQSSPSGNDVVSFSVYDEYGRKSKSYLPYVSGSADGNLKSSPIADQLSFYQNLVGSADGQNAFSIQVFETSELNRALKVGAPGAAWQPDAVNDFTSTDRTVKKSYETNVENEILNLRYDNTTNLVTVSSDPVLKYYNPSALHAVKIYDEHGNEVIEFADKEGRTICKKVQYDTIGVHIKLYACTYYIYDDLGNLVVVLPPEAINKILAQQ